MFRTESIHTIKAGTYRINHTVVGPPPQRVIHFLNESNDKYHNINFQVAWFSIIQL